MKKLFRLIGWLIKLSCSALITYLLYILLQGGNVFAEVRSWFTNETAIETAVQEHSPNLSNTLDILWDTVTPNVLPGIPAELSDHIFLNTRAAGISSTLTGNVRVIVIFVTNPSSSWSYEEMTQVQTAHEDMTAEILAEATSRGVNLNLSMEYHSATVDMELPEDDETLWTDAVLASAGLPPAATASADLESQYGVNEAPILFYLNHGGRAYALPYQSGNHSEYAFFFNADEGAVRYRHELYHLFGAKDFYYPADVKALAESYFPDSTMLTSEMGVAMTDDLTAYLIGWTDEPSAQALAFLQATSYLTPEYMSEQHELETFTGYVEDYDTDDGLYTGYLDFGIPHGMGTKVWNDGHRYEGEWENGSFQGEGTYTWADGRTYTGSFVNSLLEGYGTFTWTDGSTYTGEWVNGQQHGSGTMYHVDSGTYTGDFVEGQRMGEGTYTWTNGDSYTGEWVDGTRTGYGTYTWADGSTASGYWEAGELIE